MVKSEYFCDRCNAQVSSQYALQRMSIAQSGQNALVADICDKCVIVMVAASKGQAVQSLTVQR